MYGGMWPWGGGIPGIIGYSTVSMSQLDRNESNVPVQGSRMVGRHRRSREQQPEQLARLLELLYLSVHISTRI